MAASPALAAGVFLTDSPKGADVTVYIVTDSDDVSEVACWVSQDEIHTAPQAGDLMLYVTKDPQADATWISITDDPSEADPLECLTSD